MVIQHNILAINSCRALAANSTALQKTLESLASGFRINSASDDAAGLAISEKMRAQITGLSRAAENVKDGISLLQTADGGLEEVHSILQRLNELVIQASNSVYDSVDRSAMQEELMALTDEVDRICQALNFNGITLFDGSKSVTAAGAGKAKEGDIIGKAFADMHELQNPDKISLLVYDESYAFSTTQVPGGSPTDDDVKWNVLKSELQSVIVPNVVNSMLDQYSMFDYLRGSAIGIGLKLFNDPSGSAADAYTYCQWVQTGPDVQPSLSFSLQINTARSYFDSDGEFARREDFEALICHEMMHAFMIEATTKGMLTGASADRFPLWFVEGMAQTASGDMNWLNSSVSGSPALSSSSSNAQIQAVMSNLGKSDSMSVYKTGYLAMMYLGYDAGGKTDVSSDTILNGINKIMNDVVQGKSLNQAIGDNSSFSSLKDFESKIKSGAAADIYDFTRNLISIKDSNPASKGALINGDLSSDNLVGDSSPGSVDLFSLDTNYSLVKNTYPDDVTVNSGGGLSSGGVAPGTPFDPANNPGGGSGEVKIGGIRLQIGPDSGDFINIYLEDMSSAALGLDQLDLSTMESAQSCLGKVKDSINKVSTMRGKIGAWQRRLEHTLSNLNTMEDNMAAAESRIRNTDMAKAMMDFTRRQILMQTAQAMLAQANGMPQRVLGLLN